MSFNLTISGNVDDADQAEGVEQALTDALVAVVKQFDEHITYAAGSLTYAGEVNLLEAAQADQPATPPPPPDEPPPPDQPPPPPPDEPPASEGETPTIG